MIRMNNEIFLPIRSQFCEMIFDGYKYNEIRKTRPNIPAPFRCYIYCTKSGAPLIKHGGQVFKLREKLEDPTSRILLNGTICGEFICDAISEVRPSFFANWYCAEDYVQHTGLTLRQLEEYGAGENLYFWHISDVRLYKHPLPIDYAYMLDNKCQPHFLQRSPQSWQYVHSVQGVEV